MIRPIELKDITSKEQRVEAWVLKGCRYDTCAVKLALCWRFKHITMIVEAVKTNGLHDRGIVTRGAAWLCVYAYDGVQMAFNAYHEYVEELGGNAVHEAERGRV
jgi:hypothetical protein